MFSMRHQHLARDALEDLQDFTDFSISMEVLFIGLKCIANGVEKGELGPLRRWKSLTSDKMILTLRLCCPIAHTKGHGMSGIQLYEVPAIHICSNQCVVALENSDILDVSYLFEAQ